MTIIKLTTNLTTDPVYTSMGVSFKVIFGEQIIACFTNRVDVVSSISKIGLSLGDSVEMTATLLNVEKGPNQMEISLKVMEVELLGSYYMHRKRKRDSTKEKEGSLSPLNTKRRKDENAAPIVDNMSLYSNDECNKADCSSNGSVSTTHYDITEYDGSFMEFYHTLRDSIDRYQAQPLDPTIEEDLKRIADYMERLWKLFTAMQSLTGDDELVVIIRLVDAVKHILTIMGNLSPKFAENEEDKIKHNIFLPSYIFNRFMKAKK